MIVDVILNIVLCFTSNDLSDVFFPLLSTLPVGSTFNERGAVGLDTRIRCRPNPRCTGNTELIWCIKLYHPSNEIEMCYNFKNGELNVTDYAKRLGIDELFNRQVFCTRILL